MRQETEFFSINLIYIKLIRKIRGATAPKFGAIAPKFGSYSFKPMTCWGAQTYTSLSLKRERRTDCRTSRSLVTRECDLGEREVVIFLKNKKSVLLLPQGGRTKSRFIFFSREG